MTDELSVDKTRTALLLMDFQNDIVAKGGALAPPEDEALERVAAAIDAASAAASAARAAAIPVIHIAVGRRADDAPQNPHMPILKFIAQENVLVEGSDGFAFHPNARPQKGEAVIVKRGISAFAGTELAPLLQGQGIDTVILCGFATHMVVVGTARDAADRGYRVIALEDCCASGGLERHTAALENIGMIGEVSNMKTFAAAAARGD
jgi:nicotinamidase-related amidase